MVRKRSKLDRVCTEKSKVDHVVISSTETLNIREIGQVAHDEIQ